MEEAGLLLIRDGDVDRVGDMIDFILMFKISLITLNYRFQMAQGWLSAPVFARFAALST